LGFPALDALPWHPEPLAACRLARELLAAEQDLAERVFAYVELIGRSGAAMLLDRSSEKATHYKWFLGGGSAYRVWLHEYKDEEVFRRATAHAASVHNHRYSFTSFVIVGGLNVRLFDLGQRNALALRESFLLTAGMSSLLSSEDVHQILGVESGTFTLVVQGPIQRGYSLVWNTETGQVRTVYDLEHLYQGLAARVGEGRWGLRTGSTR
jgi:hypothetical protein